MKRFLIVDSNDAGLCNQLWALVIFASLDRLDKIKVLYNLRDDRVLDFFTGDHRIFGFFGFRMLLKRFLDSQFPRRVSYKLGFRKDPDFRKRRITILDNWQSLGVSVEAIGNDFQSADFLRLDANPPFLKTLKSKFVVIHARLGDYHIWRNGAYYFSPDYYIELAQEIRAMNPSFEVVVCTNEPDKFVQAAEAGLLYLSDGKSEEEDLTLMAKSQWIVGPPSSFSMLASNYGGVELSWIFDASHSAQTLYTSRSVISGFYKFKNGLALHESSIIDGKLELKAANVPFLRTLWQG